MKNVGIVIFCLIFLILCLQSKLLQLSSITNKMLQRTTISFFANRLEHFSCENINRTNFTDEDTAEAYKFLSDEMVTHRTSDCEIYFEIIDSIGLKPITKEEDDYICHIIHIATHIKRNRHLEFEWN